MINRVVLVGRLTRDVEIKKTASDMSVCRFTIACERRVDKNKEVQNADFISCIAWNQSADFLGRYSKKGDVIAVDGRITTGSYEGKNGKVFTTDVTCESVRIINNKSEKKVSEGFVTHEPDTPTLYINEEELPFY